MWSFRKLSQYNYSPLGGSKPFIFGLWLVTLGAKYIPGLFSRRKTEVCLSKYISQLEFRNLPELQLFGLTECLLFQLRVAQSRLQQCLTHLGCSVMERERHCFLFYSQFYEQILQQQTQLLRQREQVGEIVPLGLLTNSMWVRIFIYLFIYYDCFFVFVFFYCRI